MAGRSQQYTVADDKFSKLNESLVTPDGVGVEAKKSTTNKTTIFLIVFLIIIAVATSITVVALAITLGVRTAQLRDASSSSQPSGNTSDNNTCLTPGCIELAAQVQASLNQSADPCQDFYQFSCGNWVQNNIIPEGSSSYAVLLDQIQRDIVGVRLRKILESGNDGGVEAVGKALRLYQSCINNTAVDSLGAAPLLDVIRTQTGGWPLIGIPETGPWSINSSYFLYENAHGGGAFFSIFLFFDFVTMNYSYYIPYVFQPLSFLLNPGEDPDVVKSSLVDTLMLLNSSVNQSLYEEAIDRALDLDNQIKSILAAPPDFINGGITNNTSYYYSLERLQTLFPEFNWRAFFEYSYNIGGLSLPSDFKAILLTPEYLTRLFRTLQDVPDGSVIRDYSKLLFVKSAREFLGGQFATYRGDKATQPGSAASCIDFVQNLLPIALARPYVEQYVPEGTRENISMLADFLVQGFGERVREMNWLSDFSKQATLEKVNAITSMVAYPADIFSNDYVNGLYSRFTADASDFFGNKLRGIELQLSMRIGFTTGYDRRLWTTLDIMQPGPTTIGAAYNQLLNNFYVSAAILVPPLFKSDWPEYFNFGSLGTVVGHEITHGFDTIGQQRDKDGMVRMWWSQQSLAEFSRRTPCFVNQYNRYSYLGVQVNGMTTLAENIADNGGLHTAFQGYRMRTKMSNKQPQRLPALPYTPEQLFFIAYGQIWCEVATRERYQDQYNNDVHAPAIARVNAVVNLNEFAEAFNCPVGTPMNPADKCFIW